MTLVIVGGCTEPDVEEALGVFVDAGFQISRWLSPWEEADGVLALRGDGAVVLKDADSRGIRYVLVHLGANDGKSGGSYERAHHRVDVAQLRGLAQQLKSREKMLITHRGLSGPAIKPLALRIVWQVASKVRIPVIGIGGIGTVDDVMEFLVAGASAVQIGTANFYDPTASMRILDELPAALERTGAKCIREVVGTLRV